MKKQLLSILCPTYNHEKYIRYFLSSLMAQTNPNWELVIVDDNSSDNNIQEIKKYNDARIKLIKNPFNMGINCSLNKAFEQANGNIISFVASDDILAPDYVDTVLTAFESDKNTDVLYGAICLMDNDGTVQKTGLLRQPTGTKSELLRHMFFVCNAMLSPGMALRKQTFGKLLYPLPVALSQYQDYKMHIDIMLNSNISITNKVLLNYRRPSEKSGISAPNEKTSRMRKLEESVLMDSFLQIKNTQKLTKVFGPDKLARFGKLENKFIPYYLGMLALDAKTEYKKIWGYNQIVKFIIDEQNYTDLHKRYGFDYHDFLNLADCFEQNPTTRKYKKYKKLFNIMCALGATLLLLLIIK